MTLTMNILLLPSDPRKIFYIIIIIIITQFLMRHMSVKIWRNRRRDYIDLLIQNHDFDLDSILAKPENFDFNA